MEEGKDLGNGGRARGSRCVRITFLLNKDDAEKIFQSRSLIEFSGIANVILFRPTLDAILKQAIFSKSHTRTTHETSRTKQRFGRKQPAPSFPGYHSPDRLCDTSSSSN